MLAPLAAVCLQQLRQENRSEGVVYSSAVALRLARNDSSHDESLNGLRDFTAQLDATTRESLFWAYDAYIQKLHPEEDPWKRFIEAGFHGPIRLNPDQDTDWILKCLADPVRSVSERAVALETLLKLWGAAWEQHGAELHGVVSDNLALTEYLAERMTQQSVSKEIAEMEAESRQYAERARREHEEAHASWVKFWDEVANNPQSAFSPGQADNTAWYLWTAMAQSGDESRSAGWNRRFLETHFNKVTADQLRITMMAIWRKDKPTLRSERPKGEQDTYQVRWQFGLAGIAAEAEDQNWARALSTQGAELATRYVPIEVNGFPFWLEHLVASHPDAVDSILGQELSKELDEIATPLLYSRLVQDISHASAQVATVFLPRLETWLNTNASRIRKGEDQGQVVKRFREVTGILLAYGDLEMRNRIHAMAMRNLRGKCSQFRREVWLPVLMRLDPATATVCLVKAMDGKRIAKLGPGAKWIGLLFGDRRGEMQINLHAPEFTPPLLLNLVRIAYQHVRPDDDTIHERVYTPDARDHAQDARNALLNALLNTKGPEGWAVKLELAEDALFAHFRDRALFLAREKAAEEADGIALSENEVVALNRNGEASPNSRDDMFAILVDRLDDLEDILLQDDSPREAWAGIREEKLMRRAIARELRSTSNHTYTIDQEGVTADEKETDIRLRASTSDQQAVIELKLGDGRTGRDLRDTIKQQLVTKYMGPENCRAGCLLVTIATDRTWDHPDTGKSLDVPQLAALLKDEAEKIMADMGFSLRITARVLDLRPRLLKTSAAS